MTMNCADVSADSTACAPKDLHRFVDFLPHVKACSGGDDTSRTNNQTSTHLRAEAHGGKAHDVADGKAGPAHR